MKLSASSLSAVFVFAALFASSPLSALASTANSPACPSPTSTPVPPPPALNLTAIAAKDGNSIIECWALPGFVASTGAGTVGALNLFLGDLANATYTVIPPRFDGGLHRDPAPQRVGLAFRFRIFALARLLKSCCSALLCSAKGEGSRLPCTRSLTSALPR